MQCTNDVTQERFAPELKYELALRLAALHIHQHAVSNGLNSGNKVNRINKMYKIGKHHEVYTLNFIYEYLVNMKIIGWVIFQNRKFLIETEIKDGGRSEIKGLKIISLKVTIKSVEKECGGLERFVPASLTESMKKKVGYFFFSLNRTIFY